MIPSITPAKRHLALTERQGALEEIIHELERRFGPGVVYRISQARPKVGAVAVPTGSLALDYASGIGGAPRGRISEIFGPESCGKTTLAYHIIANAQRDYGLAALVDVGQTADALDMERCGVDTQNLILAVPTEAEEALEITEILVRCHALDVLVFSSVDALASLPSAKLSALLSRSLRKINSFLRGSPTALVFTNQSYGGRALPFYTSLRIELMPLRPILHSGEVAAGLRVRANVVKNKLAPPLKIAEISIMEEKGIHREAEIFDLGFACGLIEKLHLGFAYGRQFLGKSRDRAIIALEQEPNTTKQLEKDVRLRLHSLFFVY